MNISVKTVSVAALSLVFFGGLHSSAYAQGATIPVQRPARIKIGGLFGDGKVKVANEAGGTEVGKIDYRFSAGVAYDFSKTTATSPVLFNVYADYFTGSDDKSIGNFKFDTKASTIAIGLGARYLFAPAIGTSGQPYGELGIGYYSTKLDSGSDDDTQGGLGGKIALGYQLSMGVFGEVEYTIVDKFNKSGVEYNPSGIRASIGYRF